MNVFYIIKKQAIIIIGLIAISALSLVSLSAASNKTQPLAVVPIHQKSISTNTTGEITNQSVQSTSVSTPATAVTSVTNTSVSENTASSSSVSPTSITSNSSVPIATVPNTQPPSLIIPSCEPCGVEQPESTSTHALLCPMVACPVPPPQLTCSPCGDTGQGGVMMKSHVCMLIMCAY